MSQRGWTCPGWDRSPLGTPEQVPSSIRWCLTWGWHIRDAQRTLWAICNCVCIKWSPALKPDVPERRSSRIEEIDSSLHKARGHRPRSHFALFLWSICWLRALTSQVRDKPSFLRLTPNSRPPSSTGASLNFSVLRLKMWLRDPCVLTRLLSGPTVRQMPECHVIVGPIVNMTETIPTHPESPNCFTWIIPLPAVWITAIF